MSDIWIFAEREGDRIAPVTYQLITKAKAIGQGKRVVVALFETPRQHLEDDLAAYGPDEILVAKDAAFELAPDGVLAQVLADLAKAHHPNAMLFGATPLGRSVAPRVQALLETGLTADCLDLYYEEELLVQVKPSYGDNVMCEIICPDHQPQMASIRPNTFAAQKATADTVITPVSLSVPTLPTATVTAQQVKVATNTGIAGANKVIALGRGANNDALLAQVREIARTLGASVGVSRPLTDRTDFTVEDQIGQSGTTIAPDLLINLGISGAVQYLVGISNAKLVISINRDDTAPIFAQSDYTFTGDAKDFVAALAKQLAG